MLCLKVSTDSSWAQIAGQNFHDVLRDHAHCELKAASHALSLIGRHELNHEMATKLCGLRVKSWITSSGCSSFCASAAVCLVSRRRMRMPQSYVKRAQVSTSATSCSLPTDCS